MSKKNAQSELVPRLRLPEFRDAPAWQTRSGDRLFDSINNQASVDGLPVLAITQEHGAIPRDEIDYHVSVSAKSIDNYKEVCPGDYIISLRSFQGGIEYSSYHGICSPAYVILRQKFEGSSEFFRHYFKSERFIRQLTRNLEGLRDGKMISYGQFCTQDLLFPDPREQQKIAACLGSLDDLITAEGRKLAALRNHKKGLIQQLFPRPSEGETRPRLRFPEFQDAPEWEIKPLGEVFDTATGGTPDRTNSAYWNGTTPWVTTSLVNSNVILRSEEFISNAGLENSAAKMFPKGTVLVALYGQGKTRGKAALLGIDATTNQACAAIFPIDEVEPYFTFLNLAGRYDEIRSLSNSGSQENLSQGLIRDLPFAFPHDKDEQQRIAACLSALDNLVTAQAEKLDALRTHKRGLMQQLFPSPEDAGT